MGLFVWPTQFTSIVLENYSVTSVVYADKLDHATGVYNTQRTSEPRD